MAKAEGRQQGLEVLAYIADFIARFLRKSGAPIEVATEAGKECAGGLADCFGGQIVYMPRDVAGRINKTHQAIVQKFNGRNHAELAAEFQLSVQTIYRVLKVHRIREGSGAAATNNPSEARIER